MASLAEDRVKNLNVEKTYFFTIVIFGLLSIFLTFPLANGDEGYHLSKVYNMFSSSQPLSMEKDTVRGLELQAVGIAGDRKDFNVSKFNATKLKDVEDDGIKFNLLKDDNLTAKIAVAYIPSAIGVLFGRLIYPSYGMMLFCARLFNLLFFAICMYFIVKSSRIGKWSLYMLFTVPFLQKIASPSYDVFAYIAVAAFFVNILDLAKLKSVKEVSAKRALYTLFTISLLFLSKKNYIFSLFILPFLPMVTNSISHFLKRIDKRFKLALYVLAVVGIFVVVKKLDDVFHLVQFSKTFFHSYLNVETAGRRGRTLFTITPSILPELVNIIWILGLFIVAVGEQGFNWDKKLKYGAVLTFFLNWIGIYTGFYLGFNRPSTPFDEVSGRYLSPFLICFLPLAQSWHWLYKIKLTQKVVSRIAIVVTVSILVFYLLICYYRGYVIYVSPTWGTR